jgi:hypothetical protein
MEGDSLSHAVKVGKEGFISKKTQHIDIFRIINLAGNTAKYYF